VLHATFRDRLAAALLANDEVKGDGHENWTTEGAVDGNG
jgi:hypothetical protein